MNHPHDLLFKEAFSRKPVVRSFIRNYVSDKDKAEIDLDTLESVKDSHITTDLLEFFSDVVYSALNHDRTKRTYILFEHKSYADHGTGSQLVENIAMILQYHRRQYGRNAKNPKVLSIVINQTHSGWAMGEDFMLSTRPFSLQPNFPDLTFVVLDLSRMPDQCITGVPYLRILFLALKHIHHPQLPKKLGEIAVIFREFDGAPEAKGYLKAFLLYIMTAAPRKLVPEIINTIRGVVMEYDEETKQILDEVLREFFKEELDNAQSENERKIQLYEQKFREYELKIQEYEQRSREYELKIQEYELRSREYELKIQQCEQRSREYEQKIQQLEKKVYQLELKAVQYEQNITRNMISLGMDNETIRKVTGLECDIIDGLRNKEDL